MNNYIRHIIEAFDFNSVKQQNVHARINDKIRKMYMDVIDGVLNYTITSKNDIDKYTQELFNMAVAVYTPRSNKELIILINLWIQIFGCDCSLNWINTSDITNMYGLFSDSDFTGDISKWDVAKVKNMEDLFRNSKFNGDISNWDVSSVTNMCAMFNHSHFNGDISKWDVSNVKDMYFMFYKSSFNGNIDKWNVSNVTDMRCIFKESTLLQNFRLPKWYDPAKEFLEESFDFSNINQEKTTVITSKNILDNLKTYYSEYLDYIRKSIDFDNSIKDAFNNAVAIYKPIDKIDLKLLVAGWAKITDNKNCFIVYSDLLIIFNITGNILY